MFPPSSSSSSSKSILSKFSSISYAAYFMSISFISLPYKYFFETFLCFSISSIVGSYSFKVEAA
jgi:hypothetical protein